MNIVAIIRRETAAHRRRMAVIEGDRRLTYGELLAAVTACRRELVAGGIAPGQRIAFRCRDGADYLVGALALLELGAAVVPLPESPTAAERQEIVARMDVHGILVENELPDFADTPEVPGRRSGPVWCGRFRWLPRRPRSSRVGLCRRLGVAFIRFSSGTTGRSKGVALSHRTIRERTDAADRGLRMRPDDVVLWVLGMSHHFVVSILLFLRRGATLVVANRRFPADMLAAVTENRLTFIYASPLHYLLLASSATVPAASLRHVRLAISTAMKLPRATALAFADKFGFAPAEAYGIIEVGLPFINRHPERTGPGSVGCLLPDYELRLAHPDAAGTGEVMVRGRGMFDAYFSPWRRRARCLTSDGWFRTGDLGRLDRAGNLTIVGRRKSVIVCAGMKIFPEEVEEVINRHPAVREALVHGVAHAACGQVPAALVVRRDRGAAEKLATALRRHCQAELSAYKTPTRFTFVTTLPRTHSGKLLRGKLPDVEPA